MVTRYSVAFVIFLALALFVAVLAGGGWLKRPFGEDDDIPSLMREFDVLLAPDVDWQKAQSLYENLARAWEKVQRRIQFSVQTDDLLQFSVELTRLGAAVEVRSQPAAWQSVRLLRSIWERMR